MITPLDIKMINGLGNLGATPEELQRAGLRDPLQDPQSNSTRNTIWGVLSAVSAGVSGYHGYRRNNSAGWGVAWFILGGIFPVITPTVAFAQGFGKRKGR
jgi:hypothetical protein